MEWKEIPSEKKWVLQDNGDVAAVIFCLEKEKVKKKYQTKTLISAIYLGKKRFSRLEKRHKDWLSTRRAFISLSEREAYLNVKKKEILKYISIRIS
ncbi:hypothetical protein JXQ70_00805 [bacterium]|nr:hypothetical protein [bacterium]